MRSKSKAKYRQTGYVDGELGGGTMPELARMGRRIDPEAGEGVYGVADRGEDVAMVCGHCHPKWGALRDKGDMLH